MLFILVVAAIFAMQAIGHEPATWIYLVPLLPLAVLALTGLYLFVLPYAQKARAGG